MGNAAMRAFCGASGLSGEGGGLRPPRGVRGPWVGAWA